MLRRLRGVSGSHATVGLDESDESDESGESSESRESVESVESVESSADDAHPPSAQNAASEDHTERTPAEGVDRRSGTNGMEGVLDAISRVIRDAVEPR
jgi:hypothetical protein